MIIKGRLSFQDYWNYQLHYAIPRYSIMFALFAGGCFVLKFGENLGLHFNLPPVESNIILSVVLALVVTSVLFISFYFRVKSLFNSSDAMKLDQEYETAEEGLKMKNEEGEYTIKWEDISKVSYLKTHILIFTGKRQAILIPHSYFGAANSVDEFRSLVARNRSKTGA